MFSRIKKIIFFLFQSSEAFSVVRTSHCLSCSFFFSLYLSRYFLLSSLFLVLSLSHSFTFLLSHISPYLSLSFFLFHSLPSVPLPHRHFLLSPIFLTLFSFTLTISLFLTLSCTLSSFSLYLSIFLFPFIYLVSLLFPVFVLAFLFFSVCFLPILSPFPSFFLCYHVILLLFSLSLTHALSLSLFHSLYIYLSLSSTH